MKTKTIKKVLYCKDNFSFVNRVTSEMVGRAVVEQEQPTRMVLEWKRRDGVMVTARIITLSSDMVGSAEVVKLRIGNLGHDNTFFHKDVRDNVTKYGGRIPDIYLFNPFGQHISNSLFLLTQRYIDAN